ncbi:N-terminal cleavage protein [Mesotoga sp. Brook.08.YT.4.2.5.1]|jgi:general secretion pathway protein G|nr:MULTISPECIES: type II secretion system protein [unclassified Mesotoga]PNE23349.1 N-terminal cleavage protein [Mesotoga sp. Brook.08.YT.4.2.5.1]RAM58574.1 N-terminal cleavage protein [Mesotoga sp. SC_4PWL113PWK15]PVD17130.1 N-terminal cleavage protein [Mesotoga sp. Brook.08.105.5.1]RAO96184.1 hypothetical protein M388_14935 [Mesotoga sp. Brook.08.YT.4.2.5.4.]RDI93376.1 N-terminal cleavage protein [Mesotoga sp. Brook.08.YT.4.2.5.2.]
MREECFRDHRGKGFSLVELLIVLAVIAALIAVVTPIGIKAMRKSAAVAVARDLKTLSQSFANKIYLDGELPQTISELGRNVDSSLFGAAWKIGEDGEYNYFVFTNREADFETVSGVLVDSRQGIPFGVDDYAFLDNGLGKESMNSRTLYYNLLGAESIAPLTPFGSTFAEISSGFVNLIKGFFEKNGRYPRDWGEHRYKDLGLNEASWTRSINGVVYKPSGRLLRVIPDSEHKFIFNFLDSSDKFELTSRYNWDLIFNIGDDSSDTGHWYLNSIKERKVDISTLKIVKIE